MLYPETSGLKDDSTQPQTTHENGRAAVRLDVANGDNRLRVAAIATENLGDVSDAIGAYTSAAHFYENALKEEGDEPDIATRAKELVAIEALAEAGVLPKELVDIRFNEALSLAGRVGSKESDIAPVLLVGAEIEAARGNTTRALDIIAHVNGNTPRAVIEEFEQTGSITISTVAEALLPELPEEKRYTASR
jgi:hypothetical protein